MKIFRASSSTLDTSNVFKQTLNANFHICPQQEEREDREGEGVRNE